METLFDFFSLIVSFIAIILGAYVTLVVSYIALAAVYAICKALWLLISFIFSSIISYFREEYNGLIKDYNKIGSNQRRQPLKFRNISSRSKFVNTGNIEELVDAYTNVPLDKNRGIYQCKNCKVFYHTETLSYLKNSNQQLECFSCTSCNKIKKIF
jgi:hypothetical protein